MRRANDADILELIEQGLNARQIAKRMGICTQTVYRSRLRQGLAERHAHKANRYTPEFLAQAERHLDDGWSIKEIARTYGVNQDRLGKHFPGRGWTKTQAAELAVLRREENRLFRALDNQRHNATQQMPLADELCRSGASFATVPGQPHTEGV
jgi:transposase-like protein